MAHNRSFGMIEVGEYMMDKVDVGTKIKFVDETQRYTVQASNRFYSICTKPFNAKKTVIYTIVDWYNKLRGTEDLIFCNGAETKEQCEDMLNRLTNGESNISGRNWCNLRIQDVEFNKIKFVTKK